MGNGGSIAVSTSIVMIIAALVSLVIAAIAGYAFILAMQTSRGAQEAQAQTVKAQISEKLTLIYWAPDGRAWIANDGPVRVTIVKVYVDGVPKNINISIDPGRVVVVNIDAGRYLTIETSSGGLHVLKG